MKTDVCPEGERVSKSSLRDDIADEYPDIDLLFMDPEEYDEAVIGVVEGFGSKYTVAYDYDKVIKVNMDMGMTYEEAVEYWGFNQIGAYVGECTPVFIHKHTKNVFVEHLTKVKGD